MNLADEYSEQNRARLAVFDFDGTLISGQSGFLLFRYLLSRGFLTATQASRLSWWGIRYATHLPKRQEENRKYLKWSANVRFQIKAFFTRQKMRKEYKYFRCPGCKSLMRLHRGRGEVEMDCPKCHTHFKKKA